MTKLAVGVLVSGRGTNLQALIDAARAPDYPARIAVVISNRGQAPALERARAAGIPTVFLDPRAYPDRAMFDAAVLEVLEAHGVGLVCLAGYMRIFSEGFVEALRGRLLNIHPTLLPAFPGLRPHEQALKHGVKLSGATVHFVDEGVDNGPIVAQAGVPVLDDDTEETLAARILVEEHRLYPEVVRWFAEGRLTIVGRRVEVRR
jgi:phosphoribosylglycinamide formyltransferase-1